jgi:hypothetical protein
MMKLTYDSEEFPVSARKAITSGDVFVFEIRGAAWEKLRSYVVNDEVPSWAPLSAIPELRSFVVVMALASVSDQKVRISAFDDFAEVQVGSMH